MEFAVTVVMRIIGRAALIETLTAHALAGHAVLAYGPRGIGASALLDACEARLRTIGRRSVRVKRLASYADLMGPLSRAYKDAAHTPKALLQPHIERDPAVLLVDRVERGGAMVRREIREFGAIGLGAILAGQADTPREHAYLRSLRLAHREIAIPPLDGDAMQRILDAHLAPASATQLTKTDRARALRVAAGRPGILVALMRMLAQPRYWHAGRPALDLAASDLAIEHLGGPTSNSVELKVGGSTSAERARRERG